MKSFFRTSLLITAALTMVFTSCKKDDNDDPEPKVPTFFNVTFDSQGGTAVAAQVVEEDSLVKKPADPTKTGVDFAGWYKENTYEHAWNFAQDLVTSNITLYAQWSLPYALDMYYYVGNVGQGVEKFTFRLFTPGLFNDAGATGAGDSFEILLYSTTSGTPKTGTYTFVGLNATTYAAGQFTAIYFNYNSAGEPHQYDVSSGTLTISASEIKLNVVCENGGHAGSYKNAMLW